MPIRTLVSTNNKDHRIETPLTDEEAIAALYALPSSNLISGILRNSRPTHNQMVWAHILACESKGIRAQAQLPLINLNDVSGIIAIFDKALASKLKHPKIRLRAGQKNICLYVAGPRSRYAGQIMVVNNPTNYAKTTWYGAISLDGIFHPSMNAFPDLSDLLRRLADDPAGVASEYGKLTGNCCFCERPLTDKRSTDVGYGPVCAKSYSLPYG